MHKLAKQLDFQPDAVAISSPTKSLSWQDLHMSVQQVANKLSAYQGQVIALLADNDIDWVVVDLACLQAGVILLPLPAFFSDSQRRFALRESGAVAIVTASTPGDENLPSLFGDLLLKPVKSSRRGEIPTDTVKITFTSGSTGEPKGVCLSENNQRLVAESLLQVTGLEQTRHLCVLPLATLLENIAGVYAPLLSGGNVVLMSAAELGFNGSRAFVASILCQAIDQVQPESLILLPGLLSALLSAIEQGWTAPTSLKFIAVGGSHVGEGLLEKAYQAGLPVYEGYGLSECSSVVSLNGPGHNQPGSAGQVLPHLKVTIKEEEITVSGNAFLGYINQPESCYPDSVSTGDLGYLNQQGYLQILGRRKNLIINSFGRNISPEWVELAILASPLINQCVVMGDARPFCVALIHPRYNNTSDTAIEQWLSRVNRRLPDYARVVQWQRLDQPLNHQEGTLTATGKPVRQQVAVRYQSDINDLYKERA